MHQNAVDLVRMLLCEKTKRRCILRKWHGASVPIDGDSAGEVWYRFMHVMLYSPIRIQITSSGLRLFLPKHSNRLCVPYASMSKEECDLVVKLATNRQLFRHQKVHENNRFFFHGCKLDGPLYSIWSARDRRVFVRDFLFLILSKSNSNVYVPILKAVVLNLAYDTDTETVDPLLPRVYLNLSRKCPRDAISQLIVADL